MRIYDSPSCSVDLQEIDHGCRELILRGKAYCIWPNREGEGFRLEDAAACLERWGCSESGLALSWPATASVRGLLLRTDDSEVLITKENDSQGRHEEIRMFPAADGMLRLRFTGPPGEFLVHELSPPGLQNPVRAVSPVRQFQLGITGPDGSCALDEKEGFKALVPAAREILSRFPWNGSAPILHLFGYGAGHDRGYPDYTPSPRLGGAGLFRETLSEIKNLGFKISLYMNARLMDVSRMTDYPGLKTSRLMDGEGRILVEEYFGNSFYVMNPVSRPWLDELFSQAMALKELGAHMIQLDQVAGRAAPVPPGTPWGEGYARLIRRIQKQNLEVWIQGVSDYYPADCFEMTWREVNILEGGILRGGNPLGKNDLGLLLALGRLGRFQSPLLSPLSKEPLVRAAPFPIRLDMMGERGELPLYGPGYRESLIKISENPG